MFRNMFTQSLEFLKARDWSEKLTRDLLDFLTSKIIAGKILWLQIISWGTMLGARQHAPKAGLLTVSTLILDACTSWGFQN